MSNLITPKLIEDIEAAITGSYDVAIFRNPAGLVVGSQIASAYHGTEPGYLCSLDTSTWEVDTMTDEVYTLENMIRDRIDVYDYMQDDSKVQTSWRECKEGEREA